MHFAITFDYLCPFASIANETVVAALDAGAEHEVDFRAFSLSEVNRDAGAPRVWEADPLPRGVLALEWGLAVRDAFPESFTAAHVAIFQARHRDGEDIGEAGVLRKAVAGVGLDPEAVEAVVADGRAQAALVADHTWGVDNHHVFGVPTWIAERAVFARLTERPADADEARRTVDRILDLVTGWPQLNEFKQTRIPR
jgi:predicted DsbA family dithiol-disulfide isomerase